MVRGAVGWMMSAVLLGSACGEAAEGGGGDSIANDEGISDGGAPPVGVACDDAERRRGEATYYDFADGSGNCGFPATPDDLMVAAMNATDYAGSAVCGSCVRIEGPDGSVDVRVVDQCPECPAGDLDLSPAAFERIAALEAGRVPISWETISCPVQGPLVYHFKDGSSQWWTAVQIRNHRNAVSRLEYLDAGAWVPVPRLDYNYFVQDGGMGEGPLSFRVTDVHGHVVEDAGIPLLDDADAPGAGQFEACDAAR